MSALCFSTRGDSVPGLIAGRVLLGTGQLFCVVSQQAMVANTSTSGQFDAAFGRYTFAASLGQAIGPGLIIVFGGHHATPDTRTIFWVSKHRASTQKVAERARRLLHEAGRESEVAGRVGNDLIDAGVSRTVR